MKQLSSTPLILALDTATEACSAALAMGTTIISRFKIAPREHTQLILTQLEEVLTEARIKLSDVDAIAFGRGPGAFTGVRIAAGVAHGLSLSVNKPLLPISTLAAIAQQMHEEQGAKHCIAAIDARMAEVYWGAYHANNEEIMLLEGKENISKPKQLLTLGDSITWTVAGSGWDEYAELLKLSDHANLNKIESIFPSAHYIAQLAVEDWKQGKTTPIEQAQPIYLRDKVAQTTAERAAK
ncbi:MAG: tRNA (adenosine(37)-N6)-threonylcarbamoyltransferase complex dimerization subunit type 1 TsaB [Cocleimonas sp.]|nr:tRNA (adenosine(37)-N6)-threonylcarbamoyltransferase complex dimerization subunit type 1 TsaB [Cocleimonas sp.]